jgi:iron complex transport system substrate-binding protein
VAVPEGPAQRIVSFLPAATEMIYALGLEDRLFGVSHECDHPEAARSKPVVVRCALDLAGLSAAEIDRSVTEAIHARGTIYAIDEARLRSAAPDLILTQNLCQVCAPSGTEATRALAALRPPPEILWMSPHSLEEIHGDVVALGERCGVAGRARRWADERGEELARIRERAARLPRRPRVFALEWHDPVFCAGHWVPEMIEIAGGVDRLATPGQDSHRIDWAEVERWAPEVLLVSPCGMHLDGALEAARSLAERPGWRSLPAVREGNVFALDATAYVSRPGPRVHDGVRLFAHLIHPDVFPWDGPADAFRKVETR